MRSETIRQCKRLQSKGYTIEHIALVVGITVDQAKYAVSDQRKANGGQEHKGSPDELIDGERLEDRINKFTR